MWIDLSIIVFIALYGYLGWRKGIALAALSILGLVAGYTAAYFLYEPAGKILGDAFGLQPLIALPLGGTAVFFGVFLFAGAGRIIIKRRRRRSTEPPRTWDHAGGMLLGAGYGATLASLVVWALSLAEVSLPGAAFGVKDSHVGRLVAPLSRQLTYTLLKETSGNHTVAETVAQLSQQPPERVQSAVQIIQDRRVQRLFEDPALVQSLATNDLRGLKRSRALRALFKDPQFLHQVRSSGLLPGATPEMSPDELRALLAQQMVPLARVVAGMAHDPEFQRLLSDKELMHKLERRDVLALLNDPLFNRLALKTVALLKGSALQGETPGAESAQPRSGAAQERPRVKMHGDPSSGDSAGGEAAPKGKIYKWRDKRGVEHFADKRPPRGVKYELVELERGK